MRSTSEIKPVKVTNTGQTPLIFQHGEGTFRLEHGGSHDLKFGDYKVVTGTFVPVEIAKIHYPNTKGFTVNAENGLEGAQFTSHVPLKPEGH